MSNNAKKYIEVMLKEMVYQPDIDGNDLPLEYAKHIITKYLEMAVKNGVNELGDEIPLDSDGEGPSELVQNSLEELVVTIQNYIISK